MTTIRVVRVDVPDPAAAWDHWLDLVAENGGLMVYLRSDITSLVKIEEDWSGFNDPKVAYIFEVDEKYIHLEEPSSTDDMLDEYVVDALAFEEGVYPVNFE